MTRFSFAIAGTALLGVSVAGGTMRAAPGSEAPKAKPAMAVAHVSGNNAAMTSV